MEKQECNNCYYYRDSFCKRYPPTFTSGGYKRMDSANPNEIGEITLVREIVEEDEWCGEYREVNESEG